MYKIKRIITVIGILFLAFTINSCAMMGMGGSYGGHHGGSVYSNSMNSGN